MKRLARRKRAVSPPKRGFLHADRHHTRSLTFESLEPLTLLANGTAIIEFTAVPAEVEPGERVDVSVRYQLRNNTKSGPWAVELGLYDEDAVFDDRIQNAVASITRQQTWYSHTFHNVNLSDFDDAGDGVELFARVVIDDNDLFSLGNADDDTPVQRVTVGTPDLVASGISLNRAAVCAGAGLTVNFTATNQGDKSTISFSRLTGSSDTGIMLSPNSSISRDDLLLAKEFLGPLSANDSSPESRSVTIPATVASGNYFVGAIVDFDGNINEGTAGESNNAAARAASLTVNDCRPDLRVDSLTISDVKVAQGDEVEIEAVVHNHGRSDAARTQIHYYFGSSPGSRELFIGDGIVPNIGVLSPGESASDSPTAIPQPNFTIPAVPTGTYYITAVADVAGRVNETDEGNNERSAMITVGSAVQAAITPLLCGTPTGPGVTVISAGFQLTGGAASRTPDWTIEMAEAIVDRAGSTGSIFVHDPNNSTWVTLDDRGLPSEDWNGRDAWTNSNNLDDEIVLVFDWTWESNDFQDGWLEAAADSLFANLISPFNLMGQIENLLTRPLHFIGHSRGTVVNSLAASRLAYYFPALEIAQFTTLDPHPSTIHNDPGNDRQLLNIPNNIVWADNYYREDGLYELDNDFNGVPVPGAWNVQLTENVLQGEGYLQEHSDVHLWYTATIKDEAAYVEGESIDDRFSDWWQSGVAFDSTIEPGSGRANVGFAHSRLGGSSFPINRMRHDALLPPTAPASVFNGGFELGDNTFNQIPGWERHGGGGSGNLDGGYLQLNSNDDQRKHNDMYIPPTVTGLSFDYWINNRDVLNANDELQVLFDSEIVGIIPLDRETDGFVRDYTVALSAEQVGGVSQLEFRIGGIGGIDSAVRIDNVRLNGVQPGQLADMISVHDAIVGGGNDLTFDLNGDSTVNAVDGFHFVDACLNTFVGDSNLDGEFGSTDLTTALQAGLYEQGPANWSQGDWNFDGRFDSQDLIAAVQHGAYQQGPRALSSIAAAVADQPKTKAISKLTTAGSPGQDGIADELHARV